MREVDRALLTKELGKAQSAIWTAFTMAARANELDVAKALRAQHKSIAAVIVKLNGGPVLSVTELFR